MFKRNGVSVYKNQLVRDQTEDDYCLTLFKAAVQLDELINGQGLHVFVHCFTGISRSPTLILLYWALFLRHPQWNDIPALEKDLISQIEDANPNTPIVEAVIMRNLGFQDQQRIKREEEEEERRNKIMQMDRKNQLKNMRDEAERLRKKRIAEAEAEKARLQRVKQADDEALRRW